MTDQSSRSYVTRQDRAILDEPWISAFLRQAATANIATSVDGQPFVTTLLFVYDPTHQTIYLHTARHGRLLENIQANPRLCFSAHEMGRLLPANTALNFSVEYRSVVVFGLAHLLEDREEAGQALQMLLDKYFPHLHPGSDYRPITARELDQTAVYRLDIEEWSGKRKAVADDFPGAFDFADTPKPS